MISRVLLCSTLWVSAVFAQDFDAANRQLKEKSYSRACDSFSAYLKANPTAELAREASAKKSLACSTVGKGSRDELRKLADQGEKDFTRAWAAHALYELGERQLDPALPLLKQAATGEGRTAEEARRALVSDGLLEINRQSWNLDRVERMAELVLGYASSENEKAQAKFSRASARLNNGQKLADAEKELVEVGSGSSDLADDALVLLGERRENERKFNAALEIYDSVVKRFSPTTSNMRSTAESRAAEIRRPWVSVSANYNELPGVKPQIALSWRNVKNAKYTLSRVDPLNAPEGEYPDDADDYLKTATATVSTWNSTLEVASPHEQGSKQFDLDAKDQGAYVLQVDADGQRSRTWVLLTQTAIVTKTDHQKLLVYVADVETGAAKPDSDVAVFISRSGPDQKLTGKTNAEGVATFTLENTNDSMRVYAKSGNSYAFSSAGNAYRSSWSREQLAYVLTDRPLYKPGETVGFKVFLRTREGGPSTPIANRAFELRVSDAQGKQVVNAALTTNEFGTASTSYVLPKNAPLGAWQMYVYTPNDSYRQDGRTFRVEEYKPPEYLVSVEALGNPKPSEPLKVKVKTSYYSGGAVANASGRAMISVAPWQHQWAAWPSEATADEGDDSSGYDDERGYRYRRYDPYAGYVLSQQTLQFKTGADGTVELTIPPLDKAMAQSYPALKYSITVLVTDSSRREIQGQGTIKVASQPYFADVRTSHDIYRPGERVSAALRAEDPNGRPVNADVIVRLSRLNDQGGQTKIGEVRSRIVGGKGAVVLDADALGRARVEVFDATATPEVVLAQTDLWLTSDTKPLAPPLQGFQLYVDRGALKVGDKVRALVASNRPGGHAFVTIESDSVHAVKVVEMKGRAAFVEFQVTSAMAPNAWLYAMRFEDTANLVQTRPIKVSGSEVEFPVSVDFGRASAEPGSKVAANVVAKTQAATEVALTVVDEALFAIEPERTDFLAFFGRTQRQMTVQTRVSHHDRSYRPRPKPVAATPVQPIVADEGKRSRADEERPSGGAAPAKSAQAAPAPAAEALSSMDKDDRGPMEKKKEVARRGASENQGEVTANDEVKVRSDFGSSAGWFAQLKPTGGTFSQPLTLKDSLTSWKAIATVVTASPALGQGSGHIRTAKALMVRLQAPRFFVEGDEVVISAVIESHLPKATDIDVSILAPGFRELSPGKKVVRVDAEQTLRFDAKFKVVELGNRTLRAVVKGGGTSDAMEWTLPAFVHGSAQRQFFAGRLTDSFSFEFEVPQKRKPQLTRLELNLSPSLLSVMFDGLPYLAQYPYGCVEQTLSRFVPATIARRAVKDLKLPADRVPADLDDMVQKGLERLYGFQHGDGGWGWWHDDSTNDWMTAYVVYALALARDAGVSVPADVVKRGREYLVTHLGRQLDTPETHAFMVFALASTGGAPKASVDTLYGRRTSLSPRARAQLALALLAGKDARARVAVENLDDIVKAAQSRPDAAVGEATDIWNTSAAIEATAFTLMAYARYDLKSPLIAPLTDFLVLRRNGGRWRNTRDTAFAIYALSDLARHENAAAAQATFVIMLNGKEVKRLTVKNGGLDLKEALLFADSALKTGKNVMEVKRDGAGTGYYAATFDVFNMNDFIKGVGGDVKVKRTYTLLGRPGTEKSTAPTEYGMPVESGVRMRVDLELTANKAVEFVMVEDLKPAGFEAVELRSGPQVCNYQCAHAELRTDRVAMFLSAIPVGTTKVSYELRAEVPGRFAALPARVEAMYAPEIQATADEMRFEVRDEPSPVADKTP